MADRQWTCTEPGVLALVGTDFRIVYSPHAGGDFALYQGARLRTRTHSLGTAKWGCEGWQSELEEIGMA